MRAASATCTRTAKRSAPINETALHGPTLMHDGRGSDARADFVLLLVDVSGHRWSRAKRLVSTVSLGLLGPSGVRDAQAALELLDSSLEKSGFNVSRDGLVALLRGSDERLAREHYREQLDAWIQSRAHGEFVVQELPVATLTSARRVALLQQPLNEVLLQLGSTALRPDLLSVQAIFPPHDRRFAATLLSQLCRKPLLQAQLLHAMRNEYGEKVAFLHAFRTAHQRWLVLPAALGVVLWLLPFISTRLPALLTPLFGLAIPLWGSLFLARWRVHQRELASLWDVDDLREAEVVRPEFVGERVVSRNGAVLREKYPRWRRTLVRFVTIPVLGLQLLSLTGIVVLLYAAWLLIHSSGMHPALKTASFVLISAAWGLLVELLNWELFLRLASMLNRWENYRTTREFEEQLVRKLFAFFFVDGFLWYFLLAFLHIPFGEQLGRVLGLNIEGFSQAAWKHALVTSIATLLVGTAPLATLVSVMPTLLRGYRAGLALGQTEQGLDVIFLTASPCKDESSGDVKSESAGGVKSAGGAASVAAAIEAAATEAATLAKSRAERASAESAAAAVEEGDAHRVAACNHGDDVRSGMSGNVARIPAAVKMAESTSLLGPSARPRHRRTGSKGLSASPAAPSEITRVADHLSSSNSSDSESDLCNPLCNPWPRSQRFTSLLARKLSWPSHMQHARRHRRSLVSVARRVVRRILQASHSLHDEARRPVYDPMLDLARLALEFGYVMMFTVVWPLAPLACLVISALEQRYARVHASRHSL